MTKRMQMLAALSAATVMTIGSLAASSAQAAPVSPFLYEYRGDRAPTDTDTIDPATSPVWTAATVGTLTDNSDFTATQDLSDTGYLRIESNVAARPRFTYSGSAWDISDAFTVEIRARVVSVDPANQADVALELIGGDEVGRFIFQLGENQLQFRTQIIDSSTLPDFDPTAYNVYRIIGKKEGGAWTYSVWINGKLVVEYESQYSSTTNSLFFGDSSTKYGGTTEIDYIRWNNEQALPIPEPASMTLVTLSGAMLVGRRKARA